MRWVPLLALSIVMAGPAWADDLTVRQMWRMRQQRVAKTVRSLDYLQRELAAIQLRAGATPAELNVARQHLLRANATVRRLEAAEQRQSGHRSYQALFSDPKLKLHLRLRDTLRLSLLERQRVNKALGIGVASLANVFRDTASALRSVADRRQ